MSRIPVALLGATGTVGQKFIKLLEDHPVFEITELVASERSAGKTYGEATIWREEGHLPARLNDMVLKTPDDVTTPYAVSSLPSEIALVVEKQLCERGIHVVSNASSYRMATEVPLLIPELNPAHMELVEKQPTKGKLITNPNCATVFLALGLAPLRSLGTIKHVSVVTLQAVSGAGYPGVPSLDVMGNIIPFIGSEEDKIETEVKKIFGGPTEAAPFAVTAHVNRVPVAHGHTIAMHVFFEEDVDVVDARAMIDKAIEENPELYVYYDDDFRPQPQKDITPFDQRAHLGRLKQGSEKNVIGLVSMGHNLVRGAAGAALLNLELLHQYMERK